MPRSVREERRDLARAARKRGKTWIEVAAELQERWPELTPRAALRMAHCWTQQDVADAWGRRFIGRPPESKEISRWEVWPGRSGVRPSLDTLDKLAQLYECSISDLLIDISDYRARDPNRPSPTPTYAAVRAGSVEQSIPQMYRPSVEDDVAELRDRLRAAACVGDRVVTLLRAQADRIREVDRMLGARVAASQVRGHLDSLDQLRRFAITPQQREPVAYLYADAATLAGWQCLDLVDLQGAWTYYEAGKQAAGETSSPTALTHALAEQAYVLVDLGNVADALQLAEHARSVAGTAVPDLLLSWLAAVLGEIHAVLGHDADSRRAFDQAAEFLPAEPADPTTPYLALDHVHLARWRETPSPNSATRLPSTTCVRRSPYSSPPSREHGQGCMSILPTLSRPRSAATRRTPNSARRTYWPVKSAPLGSAAGFGTFDQCSVPRSASR